MSDPSLEVYPANRWPEVQAEWAMLAERSPAASSFLTAEWTECWLRHYQPAVRAEILMFREDGNAVGACLLVYATLRRGPIPVHRVYLNCSGEPEADSTCMEFNDLLRLEGHEPGVARALAGYLERQKWDELALDGFRAGPGLEALLAEFGGCELRHDRRSCHYVELGEIRGSGKSYEEVLGSTTRKHLRQNYRNYARGGELAVHAAGSADEALEMLAELAALHQDSWIRRGQPGAFASEAFYGFHRCLIGRTFDAGGTQVWRVQAGEVVGYIYGLIHRGKVSFYQSGLRYTEDKRLSPGLVASACVVNYCLGAGLLEYDFLAGEANYKKTLSTHTRELDWVVVQRSGWKLKGIDLLRRIKASTR